MSVHNYSGCVFWTGAWLALYQSPGDSGRWDGSYFFCWLPAVGSIARKEPPWMTPGSSACVDRTVLLLIFPCLSAPSGRSNTNPQPVSCTGLWMGQRWIWFVHKLHAQAEPLLPELVPEASRDPHCTTLRGRGGSKTATMWLRCHQGLDCNNFSLLSISWSFTSL